MSLLQDLLNLLRHLDERILGDQHRHVPTAPRTEPARSVWARLDDAEQQRAREALLALQVPADPDLATVVAALADEWSAALEHAPWLRTAFAARLTLGWIERLQDLRRACEQIAARSGPRHPRT